MCAIHNPSVFAFEHVFDDPIFMAAIYSSLYFYVYLMIIGESSCVQTTTSALEKLVQPIISNLVHALARLLQIEF